MFPHISKIPFSQHRGVLHTDNFRVTFIIVQAMFLVQVSLTTGSFIVMTALTMCHHLNRALLTKRAQSMMNLCECL